jgi:hypothetical protein
MKNRLLILSLICILISGIFASRARGVNRGGDLMSSTVVSQRSSGYKSGGVRTVNTGDVELGVLLGEPTGIGGKVWNSWNTGMDFGMAWSFAKDGYLHMHADYLFHNFDVFRVSEGELPVYFGVGGRVRFDDKLRVGLRISLGMEYYFEALPLSVLMEIAPIFDFTPETEAGANGGIGVRYIF